jgi:hypothetical protein
MFCSTECRDEFYKYADLSSKQLDKHMFFLKKVEAAFGGQKNLNKYLKKNLSCSIFDFDFSDPSHPDYWRNIYKCFLSAKSSEIEEEGWEGGRYSAITKMLIDHISGNLLVNSSCARRLEHEGNIFDEDMKRSRKSDANTDKMSSFHTLSFVTFRALVNSSCVPNLCSLHIENKTILYVKQPIKANEQLFFAYA